MTELAAICVLTGKDIAAKEMSVNLTRRTMLGLAAGAVAGLASRPAAAAATSGPPVLVELFTSQGCSSCPPADAFLEELTKRNDVVALSLNVDYWDYLGWRDTLGSADYSRRQREYAINRGDGRVYTPQIVVNGRYHAVGSRKGDVYALVDAEVQRFRNNKTVAMDMAVEADQLVINVANAPAANLRQDSTVWVMMYAPAIEVEIQRGENTGRTITYHNVVRKMIPAGMWKGDAKTLSLPKKQLFVEGAKGCAAIVQAGGTGPVLGCTSISQANT